ncbi:hypothetical protein ACWD6P_09095 [Streptomyces sp. NPDC002446]
MIDQNLDDVTGPATLQMPQQAPPINRNAAMSAGALGATAGAEADMLPTHLWDTLPWMESGPYRPGPQLPGGIPMIWAKQT